MLSEDEYDLVADHEVLRPLAVAVTRGERGCTGRWRDEVVDVPGIPLGEVAPVGTIGAGDVFAAAFFTALAGGTAFAEALHHANRTAAAHVGGGT